MWGDVIPTCEDFCANAKNHLVVRGDVGEELWQAGHKILNEVERLCPINRCPTITDLKFAVNALGMGSDRA